MQNSSGSETRALAPGMRQAHAGAKRGRERDLAAVRVLADRLGGVLDQIQEHLNELIAVRQHRRQRRIVVLDEFDVAGEAGLRQPLHVIEHDVDVDRLALDRTLVGEHLHAIDQFDDAVGLVADQTREHAVVIDRPIARAVAPRRGCRRADS